MEAAREALDRYIGRVAGRPHSGSSLLEVPLSQVISFGIKYHARPAELSRGERDPCSTTRASLNALMGFWGRLLVGDINPATMLEYQSYRTAQKVVRRSRFVSADAAVGELRCLRAELTRFGRAFNLSGFPEMSIPTLSPALPHVELTRTDVARLLWAARGRRWDAERDCWTEPREPAERRHLKEARAPWARLVLVSLYTGSAASCVHRLKWSGKPGGKHSYVDLEEGLLYRLGRDAASGKLAGMPVKLNRRALAHLRRWRNLDADGSAEKVLHFASKAPQSRGFNILREEAGCWTVKMSDLRLAAATFLARSPGVKTRSAALLLGISNKNFAERFGHLRPEYQTRAVAALAARPASVRRPSTWKPCG